MTERYFNGPLANLLRSTMPESKPDPWPSEVDIAVKSSDAVPLCVRCLCPQEGILWFCPHCGVPSSDTAALNPYFQLFLVGDVLRKGVMGPPDRRKGVQVFLIIYSLAEYAFFAPVYWYWMVRRAQGRPIGIEKSYDVEITEA